MENIMANSTVMMEHQTFQFKTSFAPCTVLQLLDYNIDNLQTEIAEAISHAPKFFSGSPVVIDLEKVSHLTQIDFVKLKQVLIANQLIPIGVRGGNKDQHLLAAQNDLPMLSIGKLSHFESPKVEAPKPTDTQTKLVTVPVRSGMQVYAKAADLIVTTQVSAGAELLADGNIHVYGPLRGRALAGVQGNSQARIFCCKLEAELVSIAGYYLTKEDMQTLPETYGMIQISLDNQQVRIEAI